MNWLQLLLSLVLGGFGALLMIAGTMFRFRFASADTRLAVSILALIFSLLGVGAACIFGTQVVQLLTTGVSTQGTIVAVDSCGKGNVSPEVQFPDAKGRLHRQTIAGFCTAPSDSRVGASFPIIYVANDPTIVAEQGSVNSSATIALAAFTGLLIVSGWFLFTLIKLMARPQKKAQT